MRGSGQLQRCCVGLLIASTLAGCGGNKAAPPAQVSPDTTSALAAPPAASAAAQASAKFIDFSRGVEKLGVDERVDPAHLIHELEDILKLDPTYKPARFDLIVLRSRSGTDEAATQQLLTALASEDATFAPAQENLAAQLVRAGRVDAAVQIYRAIIARYPKNQTSRLALARIDVQQKNYEEAITLSRQVLQRQADAMEAFRVLAQSYHASGNTPMAELILGRGLRVSKDDVELHHLLAQILLDRDDLASGVAKLKQVVRMDPKRLSARAQLADIALSYRDFGNAAQQYEAILKERPNIPAVQLDLGVSYKGMGRYDQAEKTYKEVLTADKNNVTALWNLGVLYHRHLNRYDDAIATFRQFKQVAPANDEKAGQVDALLTEIVKLKSNEEAQRAREEHERKKKEAMDAACAAVAAKKPVDAAAVGSDPERIEVAWQLMGAAQQTMQNGDVPAGEAMVHCAFAIVPSTPAANKEACAPMRVMWTQILYQLSRLEEADKSIHEALKCDPNNPDAQLILQQLKEILQQQAASPPAGAAGGNAPTK